MSCFRTVILSPNNYQRRYLVRVNLSMLCILISVSGTCALSLAHTIDYYSHLDLSFRSGECLFVRRTFGETSSGSGAISGVAVLDACGGWLGVVWRWRDLVGV